jgi:hypothetical protein
MKNPSFGARLYHSSKGMITAAIFSPPWGAFSHFKPIRTSCFLRSSSNQCATTPTSALWFGDVYKSKLRCTIRIFANFFLIVSLFLSNASMTQAQIVLLELTMNSSNAGATKIIKARNSSLSITVKATCVQIIHLINNHLKLSASIWETRAR